jgi:hypothetical protein
MTSIIKAVHERKNLDLQVLGQPISGTAYYSNLLNGCAQGTAAPNRQGRRTKMESLRLSISLTLSASASKDQVRLMVIMDKECRGTSIGASDILTVNTFGQAQLLSSWNFDNVPTRAKVLYDAVVDLSSTVAIVAANTSWNPRSYHVLVHIPLKSEVHYYDSSNGGIGGIDSNSLYLFVIGTQGTNTSTIDYDSRVVFRDL